MPNVQKITDIKQIDTRTKEGRLLMSALGILTVSPELMINGKIVGTETTPGEMLGHLERTAEKMFDDYSVEPLTQWSKHASECLRNAKDDEPIFVLRGQDVSAPNIVLEWISQNVNTCPQEKLDDAWALVREMRAYQNRKIAD